MFVNAACFGLHQCSTGRGSLLSPISEEHRIKNHVCARQPAADMQAHNQSRSCCCDTEPRECEDGRIVYWLSTALFVINGLQQTVRQRRISPKSFKPVLTIQQGRWYEASAEAPRLSICSHNSGWRRRR